MAPADQRPPEDGAAADAKPKPPSKFKQLWARTGLDFPTLLLMVKSAIPPTVGIAMYQATPVATEYGTTGYLIAITSILGFAIMPRAKWIQTIVFNILGLCIGGAVALLALYSATQARAHTTAPGQPLRGYNSSASVVCAVWLFFQIYLVNAIRSARPQLQFPSIVYAIFVNISMTYGPNFPTIEYGEQFIRKLIITFLTGFGLAGATSFLIFPVNCRLPVFKMMTGYLMSARGLLKAQQGYLAGLETENYFGKVNTVEHVQSPDSSEDSDNSDKHSKHAKKTTAVPVNPQTAAVRGALGGMIGLHAKLAPEMPFAKREFCYGKLDADDLEQIFKRFRLITLPMAGMSTIIDILERVAEGQHWKDLHKHDDDPEAEYTNRHPELHQFWESLKGFQDILKTLHQPFASLRSAMDDGIQHALYQLEFQKRPKKTAGDEESKGNTPRPGEDGFTDWFDKQTIDFHKQRDLSLREWCHQKGIELPEGSFDQAFENIDGILDPEQPWNRDKRQIFLILYIEYLMWNSARAILDLDRFADSKVTDGTMKKSRLIYPNMRRLKKWFFRALGPEDGSNDDHLIMNEANPYEVYLGDAFQKRHDPEHLPPATTFEKISDKIRIIPKMLRSEHSAFGFRAACATMSIAVVAYLKDTYVFFNQQRLVWAMIMVAFSMTRTSGQSLFAFACRIGGTAMAMVASFVIWYIVDGKTPGVIVFLFIWICMAFYIVLKIPQYVIVGIISAITSVLIIGYELQVDKIGIQAAESSGQPYYPIYQLAPYRLAAVVGGLLVAYIWTIFPYPVTESSDLRHNTGAALYLLANYYSIVHETIKARVQGLHRRPESKDAPIERLEKARLDVFIKTRLILEQVKTNSRMSAWQIVPGGKFPRETYDAIILSADRILNYTSLLSYASNTFTGDLSESGQPQAAISSDEKPSESLGASSWLRDFKKLINSTNHTSHELTSILSLLSSAITNGQPLPPYLSLPDGFRLMNRLENMDRDILSIRHINEPGYAAFAVCQVASRNLDAELRDLVKNVKRLVGELDFSFHCVSTASRGTLRGSRSTLLDSSSSEPVSMPTSRDGAGKGKND